MTTNNLRLIPILMYSKYMATYNLGVIMEKICARCKVSKHLPSFVMDKRNEDGRTKTCRKCYATNKLEKFVRTPEQIEAQRQKLLGRKYSLEHRLAQSEGQLRLVEAKKHVFQTREEPDQETFRMRMKYRIWKEQVKKLKGNFCDLCKSTKMLHVHHIKCFYKYPELRTELDNGQVLCVSCHTKLTWKLRKELGNDK